MQGQGRKIPEQIPAGRMDLRFGGAGYKLRDRPVKIEKPERHTLRILLGKDTRFFRYLRLFSRASPIQTSLQMEEIGQWMFGQRQIC
jgi:hypothetical protein